MIDKRILPFPNGHAENVQIGTVNCRKYIGHFGSETLQCKADTGFYFSFISGLPQMPQGEGHSPTSALKDSIVRAKEMIEKLQQGISAAQSAIKELEQ